MSGTWNNPMAGMQGGNGLMPFRPQAPQPRFNHQAVNLTATKRWITDHGQDAMIRKRDAMGDVMAELASVAQNPDPNRADVAAFVGGLTKQGVVSLGEAEAILRALPDDPDGIRQWARVMFHGAMQIGVHAHAAYPEDLFPASSGAPAAQPQENEPSTVAQTGPANE